MEEEKKVQETTNKDKYKEFQYLLDALKQRTKALRDLSDKTTNPLDRLCLNERIDECTQIANHIENILSL